MIDSHTVRIWIAGDYQDAIRVVREFCFCEGACFTYLHQQRRNHALRRGRVVAMLCVELHRAHAPHVADNAPRP